MRTLILVSVVLASRAFAVDGGTPSEVSLLLGYQMVMDQPEMVRMAVGNASIADVKTLENDQLLLIGASVGKTDLIVWLKNGQQRTVTINVRRGDPREATAVEGITLQKRQYEELKATDVTGLEVGDPKVVEAKLRGGQLMLHALAPGRSPVRLLRKAGAATLVVEVVP